jgi:hypothetical protein
MGMDDDGSRHQIEPGTVATRSWHTLADGRGRRRLAVRIEGAGQ